MMNDIEESMSVESVPIKNVLIKSVWHGSASHETTIAMYKHVYSRAGVKKQRSNQKLEYNSEKSSLA